MKENRHYELTDETIEFDGHTLHRIRCTEDLLSIRKGDFGGFVAVSMKKLVPLHRICEAVPMSGAARQTSFTKQTVKSCIWIQPRR